MPLYIDFLDFKNILKKNNILLFDSQYRIAHYRYNQLSYNSFALDKQDNILNKINLFNPLLLSHFIDSLISNNKQKTKYIIDLMEVKPPLHVFL